MSLGFPALFVWVWVGSILSENPPGASENPLDILTREPMAGGEYANLNKVVEEQKISDHIVSGHNCPF